MTVSPYYTLSTQNFKNYNLLEYNFICLYLYVCVACIGMFVCEPMQLGGSAHCPYVSMFMWRQENDLWWHHQKLCPPPWRQELLRWSSPIRIEWPLSEPRSLPVSPCPELGLQAPSTTTAGLLPWILENSSSHSCEAGTVLIEWAL